MFLHLPHKGENNSLISISAVANNVRKDNLIPRHLVMNWIGDTRKVDKTAFNSYPYSARIPNPVYEF